MIREGGALVPYRECCERSAAAWCRANGRSCYRRGAVRAPCRLPSRGGCKELEARFCCVREKGQ